MDWKIKIGVIISTSILQVAFTQYECPSPWLTFEGMCYKFQYDPATLEDAESFCEANGAGLVSVNSYDEHQFISTWLSDHDKQHLDWYTSGRRDSLQSNRFFWEGDGTELQGFAFWLNQQAQLAPGDRIVYSSDSRDWGWKMSRGEQSFPYICEISKAESYRIVEEERSFSYGVKEMDPAKIEMGPKIVTQPKDIIYDRGSTEKFINFLCQASGNPFPAYSWLRYKERVPEKVDPQQERRYTVSGGSLVIHNPNDQVDNGDYQCIAQNKFGLVLSNIVQLNFGYLNDFPKSRRDTVTAEEFAGVGIECNPPKHYPAILYAWYKDSIQNFVRTELKPHVFVSHDSKLYFSSVTEDDDGLYYCLVFSPSASVTQGTGKMSMPIPLRVQKAAASNREPQIINGFPAVFPSAPKYGDNVRMECMAWGTGELDYSWSRVNGRIPQGAKYKDHNRVLIISNVEVEDEGQYRCTVRRRNGQSNSRTLDLVLEAAPYFTIPLKDQHVDLGGDMMLRCVANGKPQVQYSWYRNATLLKPEELTEEEKEHIVINNNVLTIKQVTVQHSGMYQCAAQNRLGTRYTTAQLRVLSFAPTFDKYPVQPKIFAARGGNVTIRCNPEAAPRPDKVWTKNGIMINPSEDVTSDAHYIQLANGNLLINNIRDSDKGTFKCTATNIHGEASSSGDLVILTSSRISYPPRDTTVDVNKTAFLHCEASYNRRLDLMYEWFHNGRKVIFEKIYYYSNEVLIVPDKHFARGTGIYRGGLYIYRAQFYHAGVYKCVARTATDEVSEQAELRVQGPPSEPGGVFGFTNGPRSIRLHWTSGNSHLDPIQSYIVEGYSQHELKWRELKRGIKHETGQKQQKTYINDLSPWTQYRFRVRAVNSLGVSQPSLPSVQYVTEEALPEVYPANLGGGGGKVGDLTITWDAVPPEDQNGENAGYRVYWKKSGMEDEEWDMKDIPSATTQRHVVLVGSNNFYSPYDIKILMFNKKGDGPSSPVVTIMSAEDLPAVVPQNVRAEKYNATAMEVAWDPVPQTREAIKGILKGYRINYWKQEGEDETMALYNIVPGDTDEGLIIGLSVNTYYYVNVQVYNHAGFGHKSEWYLEETYRLPPQEAPQEVHVFPLDFTSIRVIWRGVDITQEEEPLQGYMVRYWTEGEDLYSATEFDAGKKAHYELTNLQANKLYNLRVFGYSLGGEGKMSSPTVQFVLGSNCTIMKEYPDKTYIYTCGCGGLHMAALTVLTALCLHLLWT